MYIFSWIELVDVIVALRDSRSCGLIFAATKDTIETIGMVWFATLTYTSTESDALYLLYTLSVNLYVTDDEIKENAFGDTVKFAKGRNCMKRLQAFPNSGDTAIQLH
jgi:hypothetical protein